MQCHANKNLISNKGFFIIASFLKFGEYLSLGFILAFNHEFPINKERHDTPNAEK